MSASTAWLVCTRGGHTFELGAALTCPTCGGPLDARTALPDLSCGLSPIVDARAQGIWRYRAGLALAPDAEAVTLGEGSTPVAPLGAWARAHGLGRVWAKLEYLAPTGSFKDRGAAVVVTALASRGVGRVLEDSSGNAGAAIAAYGARAGLPVTVFVPALAPEAKLRQIAAYGAEVRRISGTREDVAAAAESAARTPGVAYASHSRDPMFLEGTKTFAFELVERFGPDLPEHLVFPVGNGGLLLGAYKGLCELQQAHLTLRMPRLHLAQAAGCAPLVEAIARGATEPVAVARAPTIAGGVEVGAPVRGAQVLAAVRATHGAAVALEERDIRAARDELARVEGLYLEPTAALAFAAVPRLVAQGVIAPTAAVLVPATGGGLKDISP
ncbi:MAG: pyridoxal-phosphate dependent enzyme [Actinobacteria bacterium]|nr:pyridoxal-phosphate dependent enzyme [Actinomycetota bacterium]